MRERVFYCIIFDRCLSMAIRYNCVVYCNSRNLFRDSLERRFNIWANENKQTIEKTNMTQPTELDWSYHASTKAWHRKLWDSHSSSMIKYTTFSSGYFHLSLLFLIFNNVAQYNRFNFISSYGRKQPPNNGRRTGGEKWVSSHRWEKATGKDFVVVILYCLLIKYILILVHNFLDQFDSKVLRNPLNTPVLER